MRLIVNGEPCRIPMAAPKLEHVLEYLHVPEKGIAVARNGRVVRRAALAEEPVQEGDRIEIIKAVAGG